MPAPRDPVFILGATRSGTTILYRTLQLQAPFALGPGRQGGEGAVDLTESMAFWHPQAIFDLRNDAAHVQRQFLLFDEEAIRRVVAAAEEVSPWSRGWVGLARRLQRRGGFHAVRPWIWRRAGAAKVLRTYVESARDARGVGRVVEKSPIHHRCLPELRATYPAAPILFSIRHPVFTYRSMVKRRRKREELGLRIHPKGSLAETPEAFIARYRDLVRRAREEQAARPASFHFVRYEDLTSDPGKTLVGVGEFLGEDLSDPTLPATEPGGWNAAEDPLVAGPIVPGASDWSDVVSEPIAQKIDAALEEERGVFGYDSVV